MTTEPQTTDTFTDAHGRRYVAGCEVPEAVWERHENLAANLRSSEAEWAAENAEKRRLLNEVTDLIEERDWLRTVVDALVRTEPTG